jgi:hypothetical protein
MSVYRVQISVQADTALPADAFTINPHYSGSDPDALAQALKANCIAYSPIGTRPFTIRVYDALKAPPSYPLATASQTGTLTASQCPRELALCLSYYTTYNRPRFRGRLYIPATWLTSAPGLRPTSGLMDACLNFAPAVLTKTLPSQTVWVVYSPTEKKSQGAVTNAWCDDEWDTVRSRGLKATTRHLATVP